MKKTAAKISPIGYIAMVVFLLGPQKKSDQPIW